MSAYDIALATLVFDAVQTIVSIWCLWLALHQHR